MYPHRERSGHLYRTQEERDAITKRGNIFMLIRSTDNTYAIHETSFSSKEGRTPADWKAWIDDTVMHGSGDNDDEPIERLGIMRGSVLPGINTKSQKQWRITKVLGFATHDLRQSIRPEVAARRNQAKPSRKSRR